MEGVEDRVFIRMRMNFDAKDEGYDSDIAAFYA